ncbi:RagB/SusD family nutrient uptake outer membrane protein [Rufibacter sp. XAAS-G3-1]|uniref:RagB/SusD family nutrient uptake outer membrane protein n=1 Tax=Rufibacter sp. XAAS-G3-1 TaxID=2729134 RepID=UPI0015E7C224|nr:RagB/SusD family nutrient uptake outer membrane protein [Rufibacter sp. XAAS-G3-1]
MKKIFYICFLPLFLSVSSCEDFLDEQPVSELSADRFWKNQDDVVAGIAGMYDGLQTVVSERYIDWGEGRSDNFMHGPTATREVKFSFNGLTADLPQLNWDDLYTTILRANLAIKYIPEITGSGLTQAAKNNYLAQAHAVRAYCHFLGLKVWGDVPLVLEPVTDRNIKMERTAADAVLAKVVEDLNLAATLVDPANTNVYEINLGGIYAILTDAYMWQKDYAKAVETTTKITQLNRYALATTPTEWNAIFTAPNTSKEAIWSIFWAFEQDGSNALPARIGSSSNTSLYEMDVAVLEKWQTQKNDFRRYLTYDTTQALSGAITDIYKHFPLVGGKQTLPQQSQGVVQNSLYRLSDILLMRAEALNMLGGTADKAAAVTLLNQIKSRAKVPLVTVSQFTTQKQLETAILDERQFELFAEGKRWFDLRRTGRVIEVMDPVLRRRQAARGLTVTGFGDPGFILFPISRDALNENPNLQQNAPYSR